MAATRHIQVKTQAAAELPQHSEYRPWHVAIEPQIRGGLLTFSECAEMPSSAGGARQIYNFVTLNDISRFLLHPTPLKFLKRDGVLYLRAKRVSTMPTPLMVLGYDTV